MSRLYPILTAVPLLLAFGVAEGTWTERWHHSQVANDAVARLSQVPAIVGDWDSREEELDPREKVKAELSGSLIRTYTHRTNGTTLSIMLLCGRPGPVSVHTPEVCFVGSGRALIATPKAISIPDARSAQFFAGTFRKGEETIADYSRTYWGWSTNGEWKAPANPRLAYASAPILYKLYITRTLIRPDEPLEDEGAKEFLGVFLPQLNTHLFAVDRGNTPPTANRGGQSP